MLMYKDVQYYIKRTKRDIVTPVAEWLGYYSCSRLAFFLGLSSAYCAEAFGESQVFTDKASETQSLVFILHWQHYAANSQTFSY